MLGLPGKDEQIANYQTTVRNMANSWDSDPRDSLDAEFGLANHRPGAGTRRRACNRIRLRGSSNSAGGAKSFVAKADERLATLVVEDEPVLTHEQMWENFAYFMHAVLPIAEEVGVKIALHPDDPPVPMLGGVPRIFGSVEGFREGRRNCQQLGVRTRSLPGLLFGNAGRAHQCHAHDRAVWTGRKNSLHSFPGRAGNSANLPGMLHW